MTIEIPEALWKLAERAGVKAQIEADLLAGDSTRVLGYVKEQGTALVKEMNDARKPGSPPYDFQALIAGSIESGASTEDERWLDALQKLHQAILSTFGRPMQHPVR